MSLGSTTGGTTVNLGGLLQTSGTLAEPITCAGTVASSGELHGPFITQGGTLSTSTTLIMGGLISGTGGLTKRGSGTATLDRPTGNSWTGGLKVHEGVVLLSATPGQNAVSFGPITIENIAVEGFPTLRWEADHQLPDELDTIVTGNGLLDMDQHSDSIRDFTMSDGGVAYPGRLILTGNLTCIGGVTEAEIAPDNTGETSILLTSATISVWNITDGPAPVDLHVSSQVGGVLPENIILKTGSGTLMMDGVSLPAKLRLEQGATQITRTTSSNNDKLDIELNGGAASLTGFGDVASITAMAGGGTISPIGTSSTSAIRVKGNVVLNAATTFLCDLKNNEGAGNFDEIASTVPAATINLGSAALTVRLSAGFSSNPIGTEFKVVNNAGTDAVVGTFAGKPEASIVTVAGSAFRINYAAGDGNDVVLTLVTATGNTRIWDGGGANINWTTAGNWVGDITPQAGDTLVFPSGAARLATNLNDFAAGTLFNSIRLEAPGILLRGHAVTLNDGLQFRPSSPTPSSGFVRVELDGITVAQDSAITCVAGSGTLLVSSLLDIGGQDLTLEALRGGALIMGEVISGSGTITKTGTGLVTLGAANTFTAPLTIAEGTLAVDHDHALGTTAGNTAVLATATLALGGTVALNVPEPLDLGGRLAASGAAHLYSGAIRLSGLVVAAEIPEVRVTKDSLDLSGAISGGRGLRKTGLGDLRISGTSSNAFFGGFFLEQGTTFLAKAAGRNATTVALTLGTGTTPAQLVFASSEQLPDNLILTIAHPAASVDLEDKTETIAGLVMTGGSLLMTTGELRLAGNSGITTLPSSTPATLSGRITVEGNGEQLWDIADGQASPDAVIAASVAGPNRSILKRGAGRADFNGLITLPNIEVGAGLLNLNGNASASRATLDGGTIGGVGAVGSVSGTSGTLAPGLSPGILSTATLSLGSNTRLRLELNGPAPGTEYDQLSLAGDYSLGGSMLEILPGFEPPLGMAFTILKGDPLADTSGVFAGLPEGALFFSHGGRGMAFRITYAGGTGHDIVLTRVAVPSPTLEGISFTRAPDGAEQLTVTGTSAPGLVTTLEASTDLLTWTSLQFVSGNTQGLLNVTVKRLQNQPARFFRLKF
jgi:fibronectin-binding autotransporter adhesin